MISSYFFGVTTKNLANRIANNFSKRLFTQIKGEPTYVNHSKKVNLRGEFIKGNYNDLPNLIFFPEACDSVKNWRNFFTNPENRFLDYRNVYLLYPRNFGTSDRHNSYDIEDMTGDVLRFMYDHRISTATFGGHGFGGKLALAFGCYHAERTTGVFNLDTVPMDHRYHEAFVEFRNYIEKLRGLNRKGGIKDAEIYLKNQIECPKWRQIFENNLVVNAKTGELDWTFELEYLHKNLNFNKADSIGNWESRYGIYTGKVCFIFPEYSRWVYMATNTMPILKTCAHARGLGHDIFAIQGDDNPLNHWIYDRPELSFTTSRKLLKFLTLNDGVHVLLQDRSEVGKYFIPDRKNSRSDNDWYYSDYTPPHLHHNWRFSGIYEEAAQKEAAAAAAAAPAKPTPAAAATPTPAPKQ